MVNNLFQKQKSKSIVAELVLTVMSKQKNKMKQEGKNFKKDNLIIVNYVGNKLVTGVNYV